MFDWRRWPVASAVVLVAFASAAIVIAREGRRIFAVMLFCAYAPYLWLFGGYPWDDYRWGWIGMWPVLPGLLPGAYFFHAKNDVLEMGCAGLAAVLFVGTATLISLRGKWFLLATSVVVLALSILNSMAVYGAFRA